jgi:hypothetical protein
MEYENMRRQNKENKYGLGKVKIFDRVLNVRLSKEIALIISNDYFSALMDSAAPCFRVFKTAFYSTNTKVGVKLQNIRTGP